MADANPLICLQLTDSHFLANAQETLLGLNTEQYFLQVLQHALSHTSYDLLILTGDLAQTPCAASYQRLQTHLLHCGLPAVCLPGNHDDFTLMQAFLNVAPLSCAKQHVFQHWQLLCLNSQVINAPDGYLPNTELQWLQQCLEMYPQHHALLAVHHHVVPTHSTWLDAMQISNSAEFLTLLTAYPQVKALITGHIHQAWAQNYQQVQIFSTPSTCFQFAPYSAMFSLDNTSPGYRKLLLYADGTLQTSVHRLPGILHELQYTTQGYLEH